MSLQSFLHDKVITTTISEDGSRFCVAYKDGKIAVVDRNIFLYENPQRRSRAFNYSVESETSLSPSSTSFLGSNNPQFTADSEEVPFSPLTINFKRRSDSIAESGNDDYFVGTCTEKARPSSRSSRRTSYSTETTANLQFRRTDSQHNLTERSSLRRTRSQLSMTPKLPLSRTSSKSSISSEASEFYENTQRPPSGAKSPISPAVSIPIHTTRSSVFGSVLSIMSDAGQSAAALSHSYSVPQFRDKNSAREADCCCFSLPGWSPACHYRKLIWVGSTLYVWFSSISAGSQAEKNIIIAVKFCEKKFFAFR
jgi:hypothetical protein